MIITWLGHACFKIESAGYAIVLDPYADGYVPGLSPLRVTANKVLCSHDHGDHGYVDAVTLERSDAPCPFSIETISCAHDDVGGTKRGMNSSTFFRRKAFRRPLGTSAALLEEQLAKSGS